MIDFERIKAVKKDAQARLRAIPGVHAVGIGAKIVGGNRTAEPAIIVFLVRKKPLSEIPPDEVVPAEIDGVKTDVIEADVPRLSGLPDKDNYRKSGLLGGIQIKTGLVNFVGTLGCIAETDEPDPKVVALTCYHVVAPAGEMPSWSSLTVKASSADHTIEFGGTSAPTLQVEVIVVITPAAGGPTTHRVVYATTAADTPATVATQVATLIGALAGVTANFSGATVNVVPNAGFTVTLTAVVNRLWGAISNAGLTLTIMGSPDVGLLLQVRIAFTLGGTTDRADIFWLTSGSDTLTSIASGIAQEINVPSVATAFTATAAGAQVTLTPLLGAVVNIDRCISYAAHAPQPKADLKASVSNNVITFSGRVSGDYYGVFTNVNAGGLTPTYGIFYAPSKGADLNTIASSITGFLTSLHVPAVTFSTSGSQITVSGAEELECLITSDVRVGQPSNDFSSTCSDCCNDRIGKVIAGRLDLDCAVVQLDPGRKYKNEVEEIGVVSGTHDVTDGEATQHNYRVQKRGRTTGLTYGTVAALHVDGYVHDDRLFNRRYAEAMTIQSVNANPFDKEGDSGAAVLNMVPEVVGIVFGSRGAFTTVTPISPITTAFDVIVQTATVPGNVLTVPQPNAPHVLPGMRPVTARNAVPQIRASLRERLEETERQIASTSDGRLYAKLIRHYAPETRALIYTNRRVATIWQRSGGQQLVQAVISMLQRREQTLPTEVDGKPLADCIARIQRVLMRYGSPGLRAVLHEHASRIGELGGLTYTQLLTALQTPQTE